MSEIKEKKFVVIPKDAFDLLMRRFADINGAIKSAEDDCAEHGQTVYVVEVKAVASRADRPVKVRKL